MRSFFVLVVVLGLVSGAGYIAYSQLVNGSTTASDDYPGPGSGRVEITISEDSSGRQIGQTLVNADVIKSVGAFVRQFETNRAALTIRPGTYRLQQQMSAAGALAALLDETNRVDSTITVGAGQKLSEVKQRIVDIMGVSESDVNAAFADTEAIGLPSEAGGNAEGWLLPGSYEVSEGDTPTTVIARMVAGTIHELDRLGVAPADRETVLIKASIVDGEMNIGKYMPMVARVIENRLADKDGETKGMLGMDSTVLYGVGKTSGVPNQEDLDNDNPYNTRLHAGLPPTPIGQPSERAIKAVLNPAEGNWLYFVTVNLDTGETLFASTLEEQEKNREKLVEYCNANPMVCSAS
ncbi:aminodeoxychorismate lyase [Schaalia meyeri]|uniref:Endolytic murein transglycosylase n=1 Tax=Schaalia meyeri TaxID=52773 RepID=A0AAQ0BWN9_9ACTO|nr:aminodeoxychorismate lyase [Schaalia meyeri]OFQ24381.1 aminodeoxychorismate lyase [Actinomyces sp. HMSC062G12]QQC44710.1 endolytic transglycosylase MltG [Schaalia meyeri]